MESETSIKTIFYLSLPNSHSDISENEEADGIAVIVQLTQKH